MRTDRPKYGDEKDVYVMTKDSRNEGDYYTPELMANTHGLPTGIAKAGEWSNPSAEKFSVSEPDLKEQLWKALESAVGGPII